MDRRGGWTGVIDSSGMTVGCWLTEEKGVGKQRAALQPLPRASVKETGNTGSSGALHKRED